MNLSEFDYELPHDLIAQYPAEKRDESRLLVVDTRNESIIHSQFQSLPEFLKPGDLLILNETKVIPARLVGRKIETGGKVELLLLEQRSEKVWKCMVKHGKSLRKGSLVDFEGGELRCKVLEEIKNGKGEVEFDYSGDFFQILKNLGEIPLPPYIKRNPDDSFSDSERYQTVFAKNPGSSAAPTAGLHFTPQMLKDLEVAGINFAHITLHVGPGTFVPIRTEEIKKHKMEPEPFEILPQAVEAIQKALRDKTRIIGIGSTSVRCLESALSNDKSNLTKKGCTDLFIYPGYRFKGINSMLTNFHLPKTTLFVLVCTLAGAGFMKRAYKEAIQQRYRFFSYGDAMLII